MDRRKRYFRLYVLIILLFGLTVQAPVFSQNIELFRMIINRQPDSPLFVWTQLIYTEVFRRLELGFEYQYFPLKRASVEVNEGRFDGEPARIHSYGMGYPNLLRVDESVFTFRVVAVSSDPDLRLSDGWSSLEGQDYVIDYPRGMIVCENNLEGFIPEENLGTVKETLQGLKKIAYNRSDLYIDDVNAIIPIIGDEVNGLKGRVYIAGIMHEAPLYMYIHKKHVGIMKDLAETLRDLKSEGLIDQYYRTAFKAYLDNNDDRVYE